ncbi:MAG: CxxxxCH/CxxCH domain-containing protein [Desulfobulbaceae bacterium]|nr:CxxxxCH/CxxCH domain-containing protein [Desulfobulbaceae bacterium]
MHYLKLLKGVCSLGAIFLISACSGGGGSSSSSAPSSSSAVAHGVAVDPYIVGAVFQEVASDGVTILQRQSTPSDANGVFTFPAAFTVGSTVEMKVANKGLHGNAPFQGMLRRSIKAGDGQNITVTPLTTMLANGLQPTDAILVLNNAGFTGLTTADLSADPMNGLANLTSGITDQQLRLLQAAMAVEDYMEITGNFRPTLGSLNNVIQNLILNSISGAVRSTLSAAEFARISQALASDPQVAGPITLGDLIMALVQQQQTLISLIKTEMASKGFFDPALVNQNITDSKSQILTLVKNQFMARMAQATLTDGIGLYDANCVSCHGALASTSKPSRSAAQIQAAINGNIGGMGALDILTSNEIQAIAKALGSVTPPPTTSTDGPTLYANNCAGCHGTLASTTKKGRTAADIQNAISKNLGNMGYLSTLSASQIQAIANTLPGAPPPNPGTPPDGVALYNSECAGCHGPLATTAKPGRTPAQIQAAITNNTGNMGYLSTLTAAEIQAIAGSLPAAPPPSTTPASGATLYANNCAGCHSALAASTKAGRTAAQIQAAITGNTGGMGYLSTLSAADIQAIASALPAAPPPSTTPASGATLYANNCAGCHNALATSTKAGRTAAQIQTAITNNTGGMGYLSTLSAADIQAIAGALPAAPTGGPDYSNCTACHGQPPNGSTAPNVAGRHAVHTALPSINNSCAVCHAGAAHNGKVDLGVAATFNAKSGANVVNSNMTCSNISCHGGQTTPVWQTGSIAVDTQCTSCHTSGTSQYNSYFSGKHSKHVGRGYSCTICHNTSKLAGGHFTNLATSTFEQDPATTIGGGSTSVGNYAPSATKATSGTCSSIACHGSETW